jgi:rubrerythrin
MSVTNPVSSDRQLVRLLQMGIVLEEVVEARASKHYESLASRDDFEPDPAVQALLTEAGQESAEHRERLEGLIDELGAETIPFDRIQGLVEERYSQTDPDSFDDVLYDQLHGEESAYKFYDDLLVAIEGSDATFDIDHDHLVWTLESIREEEAEGVEAVTALMSEGR